MPHEYAVRPRKGKQVVPPEEEWQQFPEAIMGRDWERRPHPTHHKTTGSGYFCLIMSDDSCKHFVARASFVDHMRAVHRLNPPAVPIGRPKSSRRVRNAPSSEARAHNRESTMGSFDGRVWKQKRQRLTWLLRWAYNLKGSMPEERVSTWVVDKATQRYATWRDGEEFSRMLQSVKLNTERFWMQQCPDMKVEELHNKVPQDLDGYMSEDGMPVIDLDGSNFAAGKFVFKKRKVITQEEDSDDSGSHSPVVDGSVNPEPGQQPDPAENSQQTEHTAAVDVDTGMDEEPHPDGAPEDPDTPPDNAPLRKVLRKQDKPSSIISEQLDNLVTGLATTGTPVVLRLAPRCVGHVYPEFLCTYCTVLSSKTPDEVWLPKHKKRRLHTVT